MEKKIFIFILSLLSILIMFVPFGWAIHAGETGVIWDCTLFCNESSGHIDSVVFGEAADANDGPPADSYDIVKPPTPMVPYVRAYLKDNLPAPYTMLWKDYRRYPDSHKIWNLTVQWVPEDGESSSSITLSWNPGLINTSEYTSMNLCTSTGTVLKNMRIQNSYTFTCPAYVLQSFKIIAEKDNAAPAQPSTPSGETAGYHGTSYLYETSAVDPDGDDVFYQFDWGDGVQSNWLGPYLSGVAMQASYRWDVPGLYMVKARARDVFGQQSSWSSTLSVEMMNRAPSQPANPSPGNAALNIPRNLTLSWTGGDPDGDLVTFDVFFDTKNPPSKVVSNQSSTSFTPGTLSYQTTYYWRILAWDGFGGSMSGPVWSFRTIASDGGSSQPPGGDTNQTNAPPIADASGSEQSGFVGSLLVFNGARSYDPDGYLTSWVWDFGDGTNGVGEVCVHEFQSIGRYTVTLTVTDEKGAMGTDIITVDIRIANQPPATPNINGPYRGSKNTPYEYTVVSTDPENDFLQYTLAWGDGTQNTSGFLPNNTAYICEHSWATSGKYTISATASDNITFSEESTWVMFIDVVFVKTLGFLYDTDNDELYDSFYINTTGALTDVQRLENGSYLLDTTGDGAWDSLFDPLTGSLGSLDSGTMRIENPWLFVGIIVVAFVSIACIVYLYKKNYF